MKPLDQILASLEAKHTAVPITLPGPECRACEDTGFRRLGPRVVAPCGCRAAKTRARYLEESGVPEPWRGLRLTDGLPLGASPSLRAAWLKTAARGLGGHLSPGEKKGLLFWGAPGRGKSHLAMAALLSFWEAPGEPKRIRMLTQNQILGEVGRGQEDQRFEEVLREVGRVDLLLLDEIGAPVPGASILGFARDPQEHVNSVMRDVLEARGGKPLLATSNHGPTALGGRIGEAATSRLMGLCEAVSIEGADMRR